jgi:hypothetical protein
MLLGHPPHRTYQHPGGLAVRLPCATRPGQHRTPPLVLGPTVQAGIHLQARGPNELRAKRKPRLSLALPRGLALRLAERQFLASLIHEPPRTARWASIFLRFGGWFEGHHRLSL